MQLDTLWEKQAYLNIISHDRPQLWCQPLDSLAEQTPFLHSLLNAEEHRQAGKFAFLPDQQRYIVSRGFLRYLLSFYLHQPAEDLQFTYNPYGKPQVISEKNIYFNLSHAHNVLLIGINHGKSIGVDVEYERTDIVLPSIAQRFFTEHEYRQLIAMPAHEQKTLFYFIWTRKEAVLKASGRGLSHPLEELEVLSGDSCGLSAENQLFAIRTVPIAAAYYAAIACAGTLDATDIDYFNFTGNMRRNTLSL